MGGMKKISTFHLLIALTLASVSNSLAQTPTGALANGLINYYTFEGTPDDSVGVNNGVVFGSATLSSNRFSNLNSAYSFQAAGTGSIRNQTNFPLVPGQQYRNAADNFSLSLWFRASGSQVLFPESASGTEYWYYDNFLVPGVHGGDGSGLGLMAGTNGISIYEHGHQFLAPVLVYSNDFGDSWIHAVVTVENNGAPVLYINGQHAHTGVQSGRSKIILPLDAPDVGGLGYQYAGLVDDLGIWNRPLSSIEVTALYNAQSVPEPSTYALLLLSGAVSLWALKRRKT